MIKEEKKRPAIRFEGFEDDWEQRKLGELAQFNPPSDLPEEFEYVDLESVIGTEMVSHRKELKKSAPSRAQRLARKGDVFYQTVRPYQKNNYIFKKDDKNYVFSTGYAQLRPYINGDFLFTLVQTENFVSTVLDNCTGTSYPAINSNILADIKVSYIESEDEQMRIGMLFKSLNNLITLHQRKLDQVKTMKKYFLQNLFPAKGENVPKIRFKGFTSDWEMRKFGDIFNEVKSGLSRMLSNLDIGLPVIRANNICEGKLNLKSDIKYWHKNDPQGANTQNYLVRKDDILINFINSEAKMGTAAYVEETPHRDIIYTTNILRCRTSPNYNSRFVFFLTFSQAYRNYIKAITKPAVNQASFTTVDFKKYEVLVPSIKEQIVISDFLFYVDKRITLHQRKVDQLQTLKKFMLQNLFI